MPEEQSFKNHARFYPLFHFVVVPIFVLNFLFQAYRLYQDPSIDRAVWVVVCVGFILLALASRLMALKAQDRVIRLEESLRYAGVLTGDVRERASAMPISQVIALRFASDDELPQLVERTLGNEFKTPKEIKQAVRNWRADHLRV